MMLLVVDPLETEVAGLEIRVDVDVGAIDVLGRPSVEFVLLGFFDGGVIDAIVVVGKVGLMGRIAANDGNNAIGILIEVGFELRGIGEFAGIHLGEGDTRIKLTEIGKGEFETAIGRMGDIAPLDVVGRLGIAASRIGERDMPQADFLSDAVEKDTLTEQVVGRHFRGHEDVATVDGVATSFDELDDMEPILCFDDGGHLTRF